MPGKTVSSPTNENVDNTTESPLLSEAETSKDLASKHQTSKSKDPEQPTKVLDENQSSDDSSEYSNPPLKKHKKEEQDKETSDSEGEESYSENDIEDTQETEEDSDDDYEEEDSE
ncbi:hypothetical protein PMAC_002410 [Pneumocystis sp. 'macacae']|nr:hypothetical protein PMAC_002410 [Pneumocystis sp. 'macacae']